MDIQACVAISLREVKEHFLFFFPLPSAYATYVMQLTWDDDSPNVSNWKELTNRIGIKAFVKTKENFQPF